MLAAMRKKKILNLFLWLVIIAFLATIVVVWGLGDNQASSNYVAKIDDTQISYLEYSRAYENTANQMRQLYGSLADTLLSSEAMGINVLNNIITDKLLLEEAERLVLPVSNSEVISAIANDPNFAGDTGSFDQATYQEVLTYIGMTPPEYEALVRNDITLSKMRQLIMSSVLVSDEEIAKEYSYQNTGITASYFKVDINSYLPAGDIAASALENYYNASAENYRKAAQVKLKSISFDPADFEFEFTATDADVRARYDATLTDFISPESIEVNQIAVGVDDWNNAEAVAQAEAKINAAAEELTAGGSFDAVLAKYSDSSDEGFFELTRPSEDPSGLYAFIFALGDNETSSVYKSEFGYHIFKAINPQAAVVTSFEDAKDALAAKMREEAFASAFRSYTYGKYREIMAAGNITAYAQLHPDEFVVDESALLAEDDSNAFFQYDQNIKDAIFAIGMTEITPLLEYNGKTYIYELAEKVNSYIPALDEVRERAAADFNMELARTAALAAIDKSLAAVNADYANGISTQDFATVARSLGLQANTLPTFSRTNPLPQDAAQLGEEIYTSRQGAVITIADPFGVAINVVHTDAIALPSTDAIDAYSRNTIQSELLSAKQTEALTSYVESLKAQHKIEINPSFTGRR